MSLNPYESPQPDPDPMIGKQEPVPVSEPDPVRDLVSFAAIGVAGILGGVVFLGLMEGLNSIQAHDVAFPMAISLGSGASLAVLIATDWYYQRRRPAIFSAFLGMLLASPIAYLIAFSLGLYAYGLGTKGQSGAGAVMLLAYFSFFWTLSAAGGMGIWFSRPRPSVAEMERLQERKKVRRLFRQ